MNSQPTISGYHPELYSPVCSFCHKEASYGNWDTLCAYCEYAFCSDRCMRQHDCPGHDAKSVSCLYCNAEILIDAGNKPALIDGDYFCVRDAFERPWEKRPAA